MQQKKAGKKRRKGLKWILLFLAAVAGVCAVLFLAGPGILNARLQKLFSSSSKRVTVSWESLRILPLSPGIRLYNLSVTVWRRQGADPNPFIRARAAEAELQGLHLGHLLRRGKVRLDRVRISRWSGRLSGPLSVASSNATANTDKPRTNAKKISTPVLGCLRLEEGQLEWSPHSTDEKPAVVLHLEELEWSPARHEDWRLHVMAGPARIRLPRVLSELSMGTIQLHPAERRLEIADLHLKPLWPVYRYGRKRGFQTDRIELRIDRVFLQLPVGVDSSSTITDPIPQASLLLQSPLLEVFRDRRVPRKKGSRKRKPMPYQVLKRIHMPFQIREIKVQAGRIVYGEHKEGSRVPAKLSLDRINALVQDFHMGSENIRNAPAIHMELDCRLQDRVPISLNFSMEPGNPHFRLEGRMGAVNLPSLNRLTVPLAFLRIDRGRMEELSFQLNGDHRRLAGDVRLRYQDLKVSVIKRRDPGGRRGLASFLANAVLIRSNPGKNEVLRVARVDLPREPKRSFLNWLWRAILDGLKRSAGV